MMAQRLVERLELLERRHTQRAQLVAQLQLDRIAQHQILAQKVRPELVLPARAHALFHIDLKPPPAELKRLETDLEGLQEELAHLQAWQFQRSS